MAKQPCPSSATQELQIEVVGSDLDGQQYIERTQTLTITRDGATILLANKLAPESEFIVRNVQTAEEAIARVVGHIKEDICGHVYGVALVDPSVDFWRVSLSPDQHENSTTLECSHCHLVKSVRLTEIEMEIFRAKRAVTRRCGCSVLSTIWKETIRPDSVEATDIAAEKFVGAQPGASAKPENRRDKRVAMRAVACVRHGAQEEIVACEDMSRGGFRFKGRKEYPAGTRIEAAVPYVQGHVNIFIPARIAYHQELSAASHRHGVAYLIARKGPGKK